LEEAVRNAGVILGKGGVDDEIQAASHTHAKLAFREEELGEGVAEVIGYSKNNTY
jgi:hypothetical protein